MTVFEKCSDPNNLDFFGFNVAYPTNPYFPPGMKRSYIIYIYLNILANKLISGAICAKPFYQSQCFFAGESGSPLMMKYV